MKQWKKAFLSPQYQLLKFIIGLDLEIFRPISDQATRHNATLRLRINRILADGSCC